MGRDDIITTEQGQIAANLMDYFFPEGSSGSFVGTLKYRTWDKKCLLCYFNTDEGEKYVLKVWWEPQKDKAYKPKHSNISFADDVETGSRWRITYEKYKRWVVFLKAESVE